MPIEFTQYPPQENMGVSGDTLYKMAMAYDGSGRRISKTRARKEFGGDWETELVTHYTGLGTEIRENPLNGEAKVVVNMPQGLGRYMPEDASAVDIGFGAGYIPSEKFEWYLKNHLGSTMLVYGTQGYSWTDVADVGVPVAAYDYRAFGEQVSLAEPAEKVTENFTGKERDDEIELNYFGARYLDPVLGMWISVDPARQYLNLYLYAANNPINRIDPNGLEDVYFLRGSGYQKKPEPHINYPYDVWREQLRPAIETIKNKGYSVYIGPADSKSFARLVADPEAQRAFYMGHIRGNSASGKPDALSTYFHKAVEASQFGDYSNPSVELYLFGCNSKSLENSEWNSVFPNIIGNSDDIIESNTNAEQFFKSVEDYANNLPQKEILLEE